MGCLDMTLSIWQGVMEGVNGGGLIVPDLGNGIVGLCLISISEPLKGARYDVYLLDQ